MISTTKEHLLYKLCCMYLKDKSVLKMSYAQRTAQIKMVNALKLFNVPVSVVVKIISLVKIVL